MIAHIPMDTPIGPLLLVADDGGLREIHFETGRHPRAPSETWLAGETEVLREARAQLAAYFSGRLRAFDLPLAPRGSPFQLRVWRALLDVSYGTTCSYAEIARRLGSASATRAVGAANGRNPLPIVVPCHRVIGADGSLTGYGGGLEVKRYLLRLEGALQETDLFDPPLSTRQAEQAP
jgi:methylated-DNA-[protein]-cysteine S-methyltransferase